MYNLHKYILENIDKIRNFYFVNTGIAGGFKEINLLDICLCKKEILSDFGICFEDRVEYFNDYDGVDILNSFNNYIYKNFSFDKMGTFITVNCVTASEKRKIFLQEKFNPVIESMEGFAAAFLAKKFNLNFSEIRVVSNIVSDREHWETEKAVEKLNEFLNILIKEIKNNDY